MTNSYDIIFAGGGVMGCATAYHLLKLDSTLKIAIIERDPTYAKSSTVLSDGNTRVQFNVKENILISLYALEALQTFSEDMAIGDEKPNIGFHQEGNLFLSDADGQADALAALELQQSLGAEVAWLDAAAVQARYPFIDNPSLVGGTFGPKDGTMDPYSVLIAFKNKSVALGATYIVGDVAAITAADGAVSGVRLADGQILTARYVVNSAGAWGLNLARDLGINLPIEPTLRHVFHLETPINSAVKLPLTVFPSGLYIHHEHGNHFLCGKSLDADAIGFDFTFKRQLFTDYMWEDLVNYIPAFEHVKLVDGWAGLYDVNTFDGNAILGEWPELRGLVLVIGFSGHGFQQCHAVGAYLADVLLGRIPRLDLSVFSPARLLNNQPIAENTHKLV